MRLITQRVHMNKCNCREYRQVTLDRDFNVPDAKPDALTIMKEQANVQVEEARMLDGKASIKGQLEFQVLYAVDGDKPFLRWRWLRRLSVMARGQWIWRRLRMYFSRKKH